MSIPWKRSWLTAGGSVALLAAFAAGAPATEGEASIGRVTYSVRVNGSEAPEEGRTILECVEGVARLRTESPGRPLPQAPVETRYLDFLLGKTWQIAEGPDGALWSVEAEIASLPAVSWTEDRAELLGYPCRRGSAVLRSNRFDVWFTTETRLRGGPSSQFLVPDGLVLKLVRNGNYEIVAERVDTDWRPDAEGGSLVPTSKGEPVDLSTYRSRLAEAVVTTVTVFEREPIRFVAGASDSLPASESESGPGRTLRFAGGTVLLRRMSLPRVSSDYSVFVELTHRSAGDAYDRTGSVFLVPTDSPVSFLDGLFAGVGTLPAVADRDGRAYQGIIATPAYRPPLEIVRFITPFGVGFYNREVTVPGRVWEDSVLYRQDVSDLLPALQGERWLGVFIGNYDPGGHEVSLRLRYHPGSRTVVEEEPPRRWVLPLCQTLNLLEMAGQEYGRIFEKDTLTIDFEVPEGLSHCVLRYISTGHGGWGGGDEFNPKTNRILLDGDLVGAVTPWRSDCGTYRRFNPASGNFWNGLSSSDFSRSGWCPGAAVSPVLVSLDGLTPGRHRLQVGIPAGEPEGTSFSAWNVSAVLLGEYSSAPAADRTR